MLEARMLGARVDEVGRPQLTHAAQALHLRRVKDAKLFLREIDVSVDGVADDGVASCQRMRGGAGPVKG
jgi:hypothetical protein